MFINSLFLRPKLRGTWKYYLVNLKELTPAYPAWASQLVLVLKNSPANAGDIRNMGLIPGLRRSPGEGDGKPL